MIIKVAKEYSDTPGGRFIDEGNFSAEDFRDNFLDCRLKECLSNEAKLYIDLDGGYGYPPGFLEEVFGGLIRKGYKLADLMKCIEIISKEQPKLVEDIKEYMIEAHMLQREEGLVKRLNKN